MGDLLGKLCVFERSRGDISRTSYLQVDSDPSFIALHPQNQYLKHQLVQIGSVRAAVNNGD